MFIRPIKKPQAPLVRPELGDLGYEFGEDGIMRKTDTNEPYKFETYENNKRQNIELYRSLTDPASRYMYTILKDRMDMVEIPVPDASKPHTNIYATRGALDKAEKLVVLVVGNGTRGPVWAWNVLVDHGVRMGSVAGYIEECQKNGFGVLVLNPNENLVAQEDGHPETFVTCDGDGVPVPGSETPQEHVGYVWRHFIRDCSAQSVTFVAYNVASLSVVDLLKYDYDRFVMKVNGVAFIDAVHSVHMLDSAITIWLSQATKNWVTSKEPLDQLLEDDTGVGSVCLSGGNDEDLREQTPFTCMDSVIEYLSECFDRAPLFVSGAVDDDDQSDLTSDDDDDESFRLEGDADGGPVVDNISAFGLKPKQDDGVDDDEKDYINMTPKADGYYGWD